MIIFTDSGSKYEVEGGFIRRSPANPDSGGLAGDGEWVRLYGMVPSEPVVGQPVEFVLESLTGNADYTARLSTRIVRIEGGES